MKTNVHPVRILRLPETNTISIKRDFQASLKSVWMAWASWKVLDRWWAPRPFQNKTKFMDFREGGYWHFAMIGLQSEKHWYKFVFNRIRPEQDISGVFMDCDANSAVPPFTTGEHWDFSFSRRAGRTVVKIDIRYESAPQFKHAADHDLAAGLVYVFAKLDRLLQKQMP